MTTEDLDQKPGFDEASPVRRVNSPPGLGAAKKPGRLRTVVLWILLLAALVLGVRWWAGTRGDSSATQNTRSRDRGGAQPVGIATVDKRDIHVTLNALGTVTPLATVTVVSQISGVLQQVGYVEGQKVKKGDFLAQIDDRPYQALKAQYEGQLVHDQGLLDQARADDDRYRTLLKQNSIASQTAENQKFVVKQYEGNVASDQALIDAQALNIAYCHIVSPVDGRVGLRLVDPGNYVTAQSAASASSGSGLVVVTQIQPISVIYAIPEDSLRRVAPQLRAGAALATEVYDRANVKLLAKGETRAIDNQVDTTTGMVKLRAFFDNADEALFASQFVNVHLLARTIPQALAAPLAGIQHGAPGDYAWVLDADNKVSIRNVKLGQIDGDMAQIREGLSEGDRIVVDGADRLRDGGEVRIVAGGSPPAAGGASSAAAAPAGAAPADDAARQERRRKWREKKAQESGNAQDSTGKAQESSAAPPPGQ